MEYKGTLRITTYKGYLILTLMDRGPKTKHVGIGTMLSDFNQRDVLISKKALEIIESNMSVNLDRPEPVLEVIAADRMWWSSTNGIIIPPNEIYHVYAIPHHTLCDNVIDFKLKDVLDKN
jgi:hypothetical protein